MVNFKHRYLLQIFPFWLCYFKFTWLHLTWVIRDYVTFLCIHFLKKNTADLASIHLALLNRFPMLKQIKIFLLENTSQRHDLIVHATIQKGPEKAPRGFFTKLRDPSDEELLPPPETHLLEAEQNLIRHTSQRWYHITDSLFWGRGQATEERVLHRRQPEEYPYTPLLLHTTRRESPSAK